MPSAVSELKITIFQFKNLFQEEKRNNWNQFRNKLTFTVVTVEQSETCHDTKQENSEMSKIKLHTVSLLMLLKFWNCKQCIAGSILRNMYVNYMCELSPCLCISVWSFFSNIRFIICLNNYLSSSFFFVGHTLWIEKAASVTFKLNRAFDELKFLNCIQFTSSNPNTDLFSSKLSLKWKTRWATIIFTLQKHIFCSSTFSLVTFKTLPKYVFHVRPKQIIWCC